jgi:hypothetical protein
MDENTEGEPLTPWLEPEVEPGPPLPTVIAYDVPFATENPEAVLKPPAPPPPPASKPPPPPPATTR